MTQPGAALPAAPGVHFKDFTLTRTIGFKIGEEKYDANPALTPDTLQELARVAEGIAGDAEDDSMDVFKTLPEKVQALIDIASVILVDDDNRTRFAVLAPKLDLQEQIIPLVMWLLEVYGLRPTEPSSDSSTS